MRVRKHRKVRREMVLTAAIEMSLRVGYRHLIRDDVAKEAGISGGLINKYFGTIENLRKEVLRTAIQREILEIIAQGLGMRDPDVMRISDDIKQKAFHFLIN